MSDTGSPPSTKGKHSTHGRRPITPELYERMLKAFREEPGNASYAARFAGCERRMTKRAWEKGWPQHGWAKPIRHVLEEERFTAVAEAARRRREEATKVEENRTLAKEEGIGRQRDLVQLARGVRGDLGLATVSLQHVGRALAGMFQNRPLNVAALADLPPAQQIRLLLDYSRAVGYAVSAYEALDRIARLDEGKPTELIAAEVSITQEEAVREIEEAHSLLTLLKEEGCLGVPPAKGGNGKPVPPS